MANAADSILNRTWGGYRVTAKVGEGGMGAVYLLVHESMPNRFLAMKVLTKKGAAAFEQAKARFEQEAILASAVGSDRVVQPIEVSQFDDGTPFFIMDYVEGRTVEAELRSSGSLRVLPAVEVAYRIADTLAIAHDKDIVHRDVKPANVMLVRTEDKQDRVKLLDFGVAQPPAALRKVETEAAALVGTRGYMPPEAYLGKTLDGRADVFGLGVTLYQMLTDTLPFAPPANLIQLQALLSVPPPPITEQRPSQLDPVPPWLEALIARALCPHPEDRPTMHELREALDGARRRLETGSAVIAATAGSSAGTAQSQRGARIVFGVLACAAAIVLGLGLWGSVQRPKTGTLAGSMRPVASVAGSGERVSVQPAGQPQIANVDGGGAEATGTSGDDPPQPPDMARPATGVAEAPKDGPGTKSPKRTCTLLPSGDFRCRQKQAEVGKGKRL